MVVGNMPHALSQTIDTVEAFLVSVPLATPLRVFGNTISAREFVIVRVMAGGKVGTGFGLTRGMPLDLVVERQIAPLVMNQPAGAIRSIWDAARTSVRMVGEGGAFARALAAVDIALWDLHGHLLDAPLWRLLGGKHASIPCLAICGYYRTDDPVGAVRRDTERLSAAGSTRFKIPFGADSELDHKRLAAFRDVVGSAPLLALDAGAAFNNVGAALRAWGQAEQFDIAFLEDPFSASAWELAVQLAQTHNVPVAFGESLASPATLQWLGLPQGVGIVRPDATHQLGVTGYLQGVATALEHHTPVFPHYFPDLHAPLVGALGGMMIEESPPEADTVGFAQLRAVQPSIQNGVWHLNDRPGFGIVWDDDAVQSFRVTQ